MAKGTMRELPGPDDPMFREGWRISLVGGPKPGAKPGGECHGVPPGAASPKVEGPEAPEDEPGNS